MGVGGKTVVNRIFYFSEWTQSLYFETMKKEEIKQRVDMLRKQLDEHNYLYYVLARPVISDFEYDHMMNELIRLEKENPEFYNEYSPSQRIGSDINLEFKQVTHIYPMLSLSNAYKKEELFDFDTRVKKMINEPFDYVCELKYDGVAISITYSGGVMLRAATRGDGNQGDDVTRNVKTIRSIPLKLIEGSGYPELFEIRGEIFIPANGFKNMNREKAEAGELPFANPRNAAAGTLKLQNSFIVSKRPLDCFLYSLSGDALPFDNHYDNLINAKKWGFKIPDIISKQSTINDVIHFIDYWEKRRKDLAFDTDGVVIKVNSLNYQRQLGSTAKAYRWAIAFKYIPEQVSTRLLSISFQVGRTGAVTPVANLKPVHLAGTVVKRASLHNADHMAMLGLHQNDTVYVEKGGEIIPKIVGIDILQRNSEALPYQFISNCPECGTQLIKNPEEAAHYCPNTHTCPPQIKGRLEHFISRKAMNIKAAEATIDQLFRHKLVRDISDLFKLHYSQLILLERFAEKSAKNLLQSIEDSKKTSFPRVLFALGIRYVGETVAKKLAIHFKSIQNIAKAGFDELTEVEEIGERIADSLISFFNNSDNLRIINELESYGLQFTLADQNLEKESNRLNGKSFVISGVFNKYSREKLKNLIEVNGGKNLSSVSTRTDYLLAGNNPGPDKIRKCKELNIKIINEDDFTEMINY